MGSRTRAGLKGLVPTTTLTQTSCTDYNHLTLDPVTPRCSMAPSPSPRPYVPQSVAGTSVYASEGKERLSSGDTSWESG